MNIKPDCYACIYNQTLNLTKRLNLDDKKASEILKEVGVILSKYDLNITPPEIAKEVYELISKKTGIFDPFKKEKEISIKEALNLKKLLNPKTLLDAIKIAVAGNVIDLGVNQSYDIEKEIENEIKFSINHYDYLEKKVISSKTLCYIGDNAGENVFDEILIKKIKEINPKLKIYYFTRGKPIINDITYEDVKNLEIKNLATIVDTKVPTPGFSLKYASKESKEIFYNSDLVISKGMGNFEVLFNECNREVFYLFKVKCDVVANATKTKKGDFVILRGNK